MLDEARLRQLYLDEQRSIRAIAALEHIPSRMVYDALIRYRIPRRTAGFRSTHAQAGATALNEANLRSLYLEEQLSIRAIANMSQVSTRAVYDALSRYRIPRRQRGYRVQRAATLSLEHGTLDETGLRHMYLDQGRSIAEIAAMLHASPSRIRNALVRWRIPRRRRGRPDADATCEH